MQKHIFSLFWHSAMRYPFWTIFSVVNTIFTVLIGSFAGPFIISQLLGKMQAGDLVLDTSWPLIGTYILTQIYGDIVGWRLTLLCSWSMEANAQRDLYQKIFGHLTHQSLNFHANHFGGSLVSQTSKLTGAFERFWDTILFQVTPVVVSVIATITILSFFFWQYALFIAVMSVIFATLVFSTSRFMASLNKKEAQASTAMSGRIADMISNVMAVKSHAAEKKEIDEAFKLASVWRGRVLDSMRGFLVVSSGYSTLIAIINIIALVAAIWASEHHLISIAIVYLSVTYTFTVARQLWEINNIMRNYNRIQGDAHDMAEILLLKPEVADTNDIDLQVKSGHVRFENVRFKHDGDDQALFNDFSLDIKSGERIGLVGHSGSGKTTLTRLLLRFSDLDDGRVFIDDQDISKVTQASLRSNVAYVPQEPMLFHRSLRENIAYGKPDATDEEVLKAAKLANASEFIENLPQKFDTLVGERGVKLSGGQRQRIAIARAILKNAPILVLDEATAALDSESEKLIQDALGHLMKKRTSIVIAHRLSTIAKLDRIIVLENGKIVEDGSHAELLKKKGKYAKLWAHQSGGFIED
jgi:ATP-binding cassette, subfamily B, bacterial